MLCQGIYFSIKICHSSLKRSTWKNSGFYVSDDMKNIFLDCSISSC